jgi:hypothetical protein
MSAAEVYRKTRKVPDLFWNAYVCRPIAAVLVNALKDTRVTPNQITLSAVFVALGSVAMLLLWPGHIGLIAAVIVFELSYVLDCADGMLARLRKLASPLGHLLDFLMDELKAMLLYGAVSVRMWRETGDARMLLVGLGGGFCLASGIALTSFMRRPEYGAKPPTEDGQPADMKKPRSLVGWAAFAIEWPARIVVHYPQYIWICALVDRIDIYFWAYGAVNALYLAKSLAVILFRLGRFTKR